MCRITSASLGRGGGSDSQARTLTEDLSLLKSWETLRGFGLKHTLAYPRQESPRHEEKGTRWHPDQLYYHSLGTNKLGLVSAVLIRGREKGGL
ncbi:hypothetical protein QQF64_007715 [Cirrhinus molitorella]|uniref:Uncharacterized protein n=1 Tax=Cirrhinus molitorella TaxID=172907 RepID=A0ABR3MCW0_9TELE